LKPYYLVLVYDFSFKELSYIFSVYQVMKRKIQPHTRSGSYKKCLSSYM